MTVNGQWPMHSHQFMLQSPRWLQPSSLVTLRAGLLHCTVSPLFLDTECKRTISWYCLFHTGFHIFHSLIYILLVYSCLKLKPTHNLFFNCNALFETRRKCFYIRLLKLCFRTFDYVRVLKCFGWVRLCLINKLNQSQSNNWSLITESD